MEVLANKRALVVGVASNRSIAYGIAEAMHREGAELAFTYQDDKLKARVEDYAHGFDSKLNFPCDVRDDNQIQQVFHELNNHWDSLDIVIHSVAFAPRELKERG